MISRAAIFALACHAVVIGLAWRLSQRRLEHRPVAAFASVVFVADVARWTIAWSGFIAKGPFAGAQRVMFHADQVLFLSWPIGLAALSVVVFGRRRPWTPIGVGLTFWLMLTVGYPTVRGELLGRAYAVAWGASAATSLVCAVAWTKRRTHVRSEHACALLIILLDLSLFLGPYFPVAPHPFDSWDLAQLTYAMMWSALVAIHAGALWFNMFTLSSPRDSSPRLR